MSNDDLGFLIENKLLHEAAVEYERSRDEESTRLKAEWELWLQSDGSADSKSPWESGIPTCLRADCYRRLLAKDTENIRSRLATYQELLEQVQSSGIEAMEDIEKDLDRTFPGHTFIDTEKGKTALRNMLSAYAASNPELGYCQSMNFIAAVLLVVMEADGDAAHEEQAFWTFATIENRIVPQYHMHGLLGCRVDSRVLFSLVEHNLPELHRHLSDMSVVPEISFLSWFMCLFINTLPIKTALRVWDCLLARKKDILLRVGLAVLTMSERVLRVADNPFDLSQTLQVRRWPFACTCTLPHSPLLPNTRAQAAPKRINDADKLMKTALGAGVSAEQIERLRARHQNDILLEERRINELRQEKSDEQRLAEECVPGHDQDEKVVHNGGGVVVQLANGELLRATALVTTFRLALVPRSSAVTEGVISMPLLAISRIEPAEGGVRAGNGSVVNACSLKVASKSAQSWLLIFDRDVMDLLEALQERADGQDATIAELRKKVRSKPTRSAEVQTDMDKKLQSFLEAVNHQIELSSASCEAPFMRKAEGFDDQGLGVYDAKKEFARQGALSESSGWRATSMNEQYELCATYPSVVLVPNSVTDEQLQEVVKFRSKQRLPALSWYDSESQAAIVRCAQPLVGALGKKSVADEAYFDEIIKANTQNRGIAMLDARPKVNAVANRGRGGGYENIDRYDAGMATLVFLDIDNIHVMRGSINEMHGLVGSEDRTDPIRRMDFQLGWLVHLGRLLGGAATIVREVGDKKRTALVHCSDGWDRTAQLCALAEMCLDSYYRTFDGFQVLCQREWLSFGHKFQDRTWGHKLKERSPVFLQFLDCVHQMIEEYPTAFEFNQSMLLFVLDSMYSLEFSEFRHNCERPRTLAAQADPPAGSTSMWRIARADVYHNPSYVQTGLIRPPIRARVWTQYFNRWKIDPISGQIPSSGHAEEPLAPTWTMEMLTSEEPESVAPATQLMFHDPKPVKEGWVFHNVRTKVGYSTKPRWLALHPSLHGEACLVFFERQSSESIVPCDVVPLQDGEFQVRMMPKRSASIRKHCFQIRHKAHQTMSGSNAEACISVKARSASTLELILREGEQAKWQANVTKFDVKISLKFVAADPGQPGAEEIIEPEQVIGDPKEPSRGGIVSGLFRAQTAGTLRLIIDNSYSKLRNKDVRYILEGSIEVAAEAIEQLTRDSEDDVPDKAGLVQTLSVHTAGRERSRAMAGLLAQRVANTSIAVKLKSLQLIDQLLATGSEHFKAEIAKSVLSQHIKGLRDFSEEHPTHGDKPAQMIRTQAKSVSDMLQAELDAATPRGREAQVREVFDKQNLYVETEEEMNAWVEAIQRVSGQKIISVASDDEEEEETGLRKLTERLSTAAEFDGGGEGLLPPEQGEIDIQVKARKDQPIQFDLKAGERLQWDLQLEKYDVRSRAVFKYVAPPEGVMGDARLGGGIAVGEVVKIGDGFTFVTGNPKDPEQGGKTEFAYTADRGDGCLQLTLDNSYSKMRAKRVRLTVKLTGADGQPIECNVIHSGGTRFTFVAERPAA